MKIKAKVKEKGVNLRMDSSKRHIQVNGSAPVV
jgi:hypothetical protein